MKNSEMTKRAWLSALKEVNITYQFGWSMVPRYLVKHYL